MDLADLPQDIILVILSYLEAYDLLRCHLVSRKWRITLSDDTYLRSFLKSYPNAREVRDLVAKDPNAFHYSSSSLSSDTLADIFRTVTTRYYHLKQGKIRRLSRYPLCALDQSSHWHPTPQWDYHESQPGGRLYHEAANHVMSANRKPYLFRQMLWSYDDGFVVFAPRVMPRVLPSLKEVGGGWDGDDPWAGVKGGDRKGKRGRRYVLAVLDLENNDVVTVPFDVTDRVIRNTRLKQGTLIVEWAEKDPYHDLNLVDKVHRHFATVYDVRRQPRGSSSEKETGLTISITFRLEFKIHFLGLPLTARDYFFSTHTRNYYALYLWQPNRSLWTGDEDQPIEALFVWDVRSPSAYRPSEDPGNKRTYEVDQGPVMVGRFSFALLEHLGIRQRANISLISLVVEELEDGGNIVWKENIHVSGQGYFDPAERNWRSRVTSFPFKAFGPACVRIGAEELVAYRGSVSMESSELEEEEVEKWFLPVMDVVDREADVRFALLETCFSGMGMINRIMVRVKVGEEGEWVNVEGDAIEELSVMGRIAGDERWIVGMNGKLEVVVGRFQ